jgi:hypothetical protein
MKMFIDHPEHCAQGSDLFRCRDCRTDQEWRDLIRQDWEVPSDWDEVCPWGIELEQLNNMSLVPIKAKRKRRSRGLGDTIAKLIHRLTLGLVKPCCACRQRQAFLNKLIPYRNKVGE